MGLRQTHFLLSGKNLTVSLNPLKLMLCSPDQFSSSTVGPSFIASAPGCLSLKRRGTSRTTSATMYWAQRFIRPTTVLRGKPNHVRIQAQMSTPQSAHQDNV